MSNRWPRVEWNTDIPLTGEDPIGCIVDGFSDPEPLGVWTVGAMARMAFALSPAKHDVFLVLDLVPFHIAPLMTEQTLEVYINSERAASTELVSPDRTYVIIPVSRNTLERSNPVVVSFVLPRARSPRSLRLNADSRALGVAIRTVRWVDLLPTYQTGADILTTSGFSTNPYLLFGWSFREPVFTWSDGPAAALLLRMSDAAEDLEFAARVTPFRPDAARPEIRVRVSINERPAGEWVLGGHEVSVQTFRVPAGTIREGGWAYIRFDIEGAVSPREAGISVDRRQLGFALTQFSLKPTGRTARTGGATQLEVIPRGEWTIAPTAILPVAGGVGGSTIAECELRAMEEPAIVSVFVDEFRVARLPVTSREFERHTFVIPSGIARWTRASYVRFVCHSNVEDLHETDSVHHAAVLRSFALRGQAATETSKPIDSAAVVDLRVGQVIEATADLLPHGWTALENGGVRSVSDRPVIDLRVRDPLPLIFSCDLTAAFLGDARSVETVTLRVNGRIGTVVRFGGSETLTAELDLTAADLLNDGLCRIDLLLEPAVSRSVLDKPAAILTKFRLTVPERP